MIKTIWKDIVGYEGLYKINTHGDIVILSGKYKGKLIQPHALKKGYLRVSLTKNKVRKKHMVHRLVAQVFIPNPDNLPQVNHKDECKTNNYVDNLEWCTLLYNVRYGNGISKRSQTNSKPVLQYDLDMNFIKRYPSMKSACEGNDWLISGIVNVCKQRKGYDTYKGYIWRYADD